MRFGSEMGTPLPPQVGWAKITNPWAGPGLLLAPCGPHQAHVFLTRTMRNQLEPMPSLQWAPRTHEGSCLIGSPAWHQGYRLGAQVTGTGVTWCGRGWQRPDRQPVVGASLPPYFLAAWTPCCGFTVPAHHTAPIQTRGHTREGVQNEGCVESKRKGKTKVCVPDRGPGGTGVQGPEGRRWPT